MKKLFSIIFTALIILSGVHLSVDTHLCGGKVAFVKWSVVGEFANCGMEMLSQTDHTANTVVTKSCCKDEISFFTVDSNYNSSTFQIQEPAQQLIQLFYVPQSAVGYSFNEFTVRNTNVLPPGKYIPSAVSLPDICVFLI